MDARGNPGRRQAALALFDALGQRPYNPSEKGGGIPPAGPPAPAKPARTRRKGGAKGAGALSDPAALEPAQSAREPARPVLAPSACKPEPPFPDRALQKRKPEPEPAPEPEACELPPDEFDEPADVTPLVKPLSRERIAARKARFAELVRDFGRQCDKGWTVPGTLDRFALLQRKGTSGPRWLSTWESPDHAAEYITGDDSGFAPESLFDLDTGDEFEPVIATHFRLVLR